jgi:hypothetical protein
MSGQTNGGVFNPKNLSLMSYTYNNPVNLVDPNGLENVVVVGAQHDESKGNKLMFVNQGIRAMKEFASNESGESRTMLMMSQGYSKNQINATRKSVEAYGGKLQMVSGVQGIADYINNRSSDPVTNMEVYSHGIPSGIKLAYGMGVEIDNASTTISQSSASLFGSSGFSSDAQVNLYSCRSAISNDSELAMFGGRSNSVAQALANSTGATVYGFSKRTDYSGTTGSRLYNFMNGPSPTRMIDGAIFMPQGASMGVSADWSPIFMPPHHSVFKAQR